MATNSTADDNFVRSLFSFPNPVNEVAARLVAGMTLAIALVTIATGAPWLLAVLVYEFIARVATGPTLSPMGSLATRVIAPRMATPRLVPGPPKRFAQGVGLVFSVTASVLYLVTGSMFAPSIVLAVLSVFAALEAFAGFCAGCLVFGYLMKWGLISRSVCEQCVVGPITAEERA